MVYIEDDEDGIYICIYIYIDCREYWYPTRETGETKVNWKLRISLVDASLRISLEDAGPPTLIVSIFIYPSSHSKIYSPIHPFIQ